MKLAIVLPVAMLAGGCDLLFDLHQIDPATGDAAIDHDARAVDADQADADTAICGMHDEDGDGAFDKCDKCPTIVDPGDADMDGDSVGDLCDPDPGLPNTIDAFYSFQTGTAFTGNGDTYPNDALRLGGTIVSNKTFSSPEVIDLSVSDLPDGHNIEIVANPSGASTITCELATICSGSSPTCLFLSTSGGMNMSLALTVLPAEVTHLVLYRTLGEVRCSVNGRAADHTLAMPGVTMPSGNVELSSLAGQVTMPSLIVYNVQ